MCCRLRLDTSELRKRGGGLFGSNPMTGSIGVVTVNLPRLGYLAKTESEFQARLWRTIQLAKESLEIKRKIIEEQTAGGFIPIRRITFAISKNGPVSIGITTLIRSVWSG